MIRLYQGPGSGEIQLTGPHMELDAWSKLKATVCELLSVRGQEDASRLLESIPFEIREGTNGFGDEFSLLYVETSVDQYVELAKLDEDPSVKASLRQIARAVSEVGPPIRFIAVALQDRAALQAVKNPTLLITSDIVERALADSEQLIHSRGVLSGADRIHTALHGYLRALCERHHVDVPHDAAITALFKGLRQHPVFIENGPAVAQVQRITQSIATIIDSLNPLRNRATLAHANEAVLDEPEAMLLINEVRTLLHYLNAKLS